MLIREYNVKDINAILNLGKLLHNDYKFLLDEFSKCIVIEEDNNILGFLVYSIIYERSEIIDIIINPAYRKKGLGYGLLNYAINDIIKRNCDNITLEVNCINTSAINLYKKSGFKIETIRKNYYNDNDGYLMKKDLR